MTFVSRGCYLDTVANSLRLTGEEPMSHRRPRRPRDHVEARARRRAERRDAALRRIFRQSKGEVLA